jgi:hypothetical protein
VRSSCHGSLPVLLQEHRAVCQERGCSTRGSPRHAAAVGVATTALKARGPGHRVHKKVTRTKHKIALTRCCRQGQQGQQGPQGQRGQRGQRGRTVSRAHRVGHLSACQTGASDGC